MYNLSAKRRGRPPNHQARRAIFERVKRMNNDQYRVLLYGFVKRLKQRGNKDARRLAPYVTRGGDHSINARQRIESALTSGKITGERYGDLIEALENVLAEMNAACSLIDTREPKEWLDMGNGAKMHRVLKEPDEGDYEAAQRRASKGGAA